MTPLETRVTARADETIKLYCETVQENLKPNWFFNEVLIDPVNEHSRKKEFYSTSTQHLLVINDVQESDSGMYKLRFGAEHEFYSELIVNKMGDYLIEPPSPPLDNSPKSFTQLVRPLNDLKCTENDTIHLECAFSRDLNAHDLIEWKKNGITVRPAFNVEFICEANKCILRISACSKADAGFYELCLVELNKHQQLSDNDAVLKSNCQVYVTSYVDKAEILKQLPRLLKLNEGETLRLETVLDKKPESVNWYRNSAQHITPEETAKSRTNLFELEEGKIQILLISNAQANVHDGTYQLNADDKITICEVRIKPAAARFEQRPPEKLVHDMDKPAKRSVISLILRNKNDCSFSQSWAIEPF